VFYVGEFWAKHVEVRLGEVRCACGRQAAGGVMHGSKILLVDDDPAIRGFTSLTLEWEGFIVVTAADGAEGLQMVCDEAPEAILLDMMMPGVTGWDFLRRWREDPAYRPVPVIVVTACGEGIRADELGVQAIFTKPFNLDRLIGKLTSLLA